MEGDREPPWDRDEFQSRLRDVGRRAYHDKHPFHVAMNAGELTPDQVRALAGNRVSVTGTVPDVRPYYSGALAAVVPLRIGSGTRLKILEAMAAGVPIVSTRLGAEGIDVTHNLHLLIADNGTELVSAIDTLFSSPEMRNRLVQTARDQVIRRYDWSVVGNDLFSIYVDLLSKSR